MLADVVLLCRPRSAAEPWCRYRRLYNLPEKGTLPFILAVVSRGTLASFLNKGSVPFSGVAHVTDTDCYSLRSGAWCLQQSASQAASRQQRERAGISGLAVGTECWYAEWIAVGAECRYAERLAVGVECWYAEWIAVPVGCWRTKRIAIGCKSGFSFRLSGRCKFRCPVRYSGGCKKRTGFDGPIGG